MLFAAQYLQLNPGADQAQAGLILICCSAAPIIASVKMVTKRLNIQKMLVSSISTWSGMLTSKMPQSSRRKQREKDKVGEVDGNGWPNNSIAEPGVEFGINPMHKNSRFKGVVAAATVNDLHMSEELTGTELQPTKEASSKNSGDKLTHKSL